jgi:tungstate transport system permease protein
MNTVADAVAQALELVATLDPKVVGIVFLSLQVSLAAVMLGCLVGLPLGAAVAVSDFRGRRTLIVILNALMGLPSVVVGLVVYLLLSRAGPLGSWGILFTPTAMVIAQSILITPTLAALSRQVVADGWQEYREQLHSLGETRAGAAGTLLWDLRFSLVTIVLAGFGRAASEVGAVMIVGGNIDGVTRVMTTTIALETSKGDLPLALALGFILLAIVLAVNAGAYVVNGNDAASLRMTAENRMARPLSLLPTASRQRRVRGGRTPDHQGCVDDDPRGPRTILLGPNGAGKSVLLRLIHGSSRLPREPFRWNAPELPGGPRRQAMVFQRPVLLRRTALGNVTYALKLAGIASGAREDRATTRCARSVLFGRRSRSARAVGRRATAAGTRAGVGAASRDPVSRRADGEPRPGRHARDREHHPRAARGRHEDRDGHAQPRTGETAR